MLQNSAHQFLKEKKLIYQFIVILIVPCNKTVPTSFLKEKNLYISYHDFDSPMLQNSAYQFSKGKKFIYQLSWFW